jgi:hypothetical protein
MMNDNREATLEDLLNEPVIRSMMARDGVRAAEVRRLMEQARDRQELRLQRPCHPV